VAVCSALGTPVDGLSGLFYLANSGYIALEPGLYDWFVGTPGCATQLFDLPPFRATPGSVATILLVGGANGQPLTSVLVVDEVGQNRLYLPIIRLPL